MSTSSMTNSTINPIPKNQQSPCPPQPYFELTFLVLATYMPIQAVFIGQIKVCVCVWLATSSPLAAVWRTLV
jgi:hypothetical protein